MHFNAQLYCEENSQLTFLLSASNTQPESICLGNAYIE